LATNRMTAAISRLWLPKESEVSSSWISSLINLSSSVTHQMTLPVRITSALGLSPWELGDFTPPKI